MSDSNNTNSPSGGGQSGTNQPASNPTPVLVTKPVVPIMETRNDNSKPSSKPMTPPVKKG